LQIWFDCTLLQKAPYATTLVALHHGHYLISISPLPTLSEIQYTVATENINAIELYSWWCWKSPSWVFGTL